MYCLWQQDQGCKVNQYRWLLLLLSLQRNGTTGVPFPNFNFPISASMCERICLQLPQMLPDQQCVKTARMASLPNNLACSRNSNTTVRLTSLGEKKKKKKNVPILEVSYFVWEETIDHSSLLNFAHNISFWKLNNWNCRSKAGAHIDTARQ